MSTITQSPPDGRVCTLCKEWKPRSEFTPIKKSPERIRSHCKPCALERRRLHKRGILPSTKRGLRIELRDPDGHRERKRRNALAWRLRNPEKVNVRGIASVHRARARKAGVSGSFTIEEWEALCELYGNKCLRCGSSERITVDHVVSLRKGGSNDISNLQPLCWKCNNWKRSRTIDYRLTYNDQ